MCHIDNKLVGLLLIWVDDIFYTGTDEFENKVMKKINKEFLIGRTEEETFTYIGLAIDTVTDGITLDQTRYIHEKLEPALLKNGDAKRPLDKEECKLLRRIVGKINWTATQTRPDVSFSVVELSTKFKNPQLEDLKKANKVISKLLTTPTKVLFPKLVGNLKIITFSDAAFRNLPDQISSGRGHIVFLAGENGKVAPLGWNSNKIKRVVGSTLAAEALSLRSALDHANFLRAILAEIMQENMLEIPIISVIDSNNLLEASLSTKFVEDKKLRLDIAQIQESLSTENVTLQWIETALMLADSLTKNGVNSDPLLNVLSTGNLRLEIRKEKME